ncbi:PREDICTED: uncharacterized protein LOC109132105, partial [Camelina sativa]|uniref:Uncharacterized protein LOC109132105 n=1 Tax=Camelina sativa TaxID=90675 RepID=A0ABM1RIC8_CAMSA
ILIVATLIALWMIGEPVDYENFEISKASFRETMRILAIMMATLYYAVSVQVLFALVIGVINHIRFVKEMGLLHGFLTLAFFLMNLF